MTSKSYAIGIDLGTTYSCVGVYRNGGVEIIANELGERTMPSYVAFTDGGIVVGKPAKNLVNTEKQGNVVFDVKRLIGREYTDSTVQDDMKYWPFKVANRDGKPYVELQWRGETLFKSPQEISSLVLRKLKNVAEDYLGCPVTDAVITVPAYFSDNQRHCTREAGQLAGLNVLRVLSEPTAAAIAYGLGQCPNVDEQDRQAALNGYVSAHEMNTTDAPAPAPAPACDDPDVDALMRELEETVDAAPTPAAPQPSLSTSSVEQQVLVFDLGGGTFDVSLLVMEGGFFQVRATAGDTHLGGEDLDNKLVKYLLGAFVKQHASALRSKPSAATDAGKRCLRRLRTAAESLKRELSSHVFARVEIDKLWEGLPLSVGLSRPAMEKLCAPEFDRCIEPVQRVLKDCKVDISRVTDVVLVGGSTRIPRIKQLLQDLLKKEPNASINPDEAVAYGAAVQAAIITGGVDDEQQGGISELLLVDVAPLSLGVETAGSHMSVLINRNSSVPIAVKRSYSTDRDNQTEVDINVYEGERADVKDNIHLGKVSLEGIPPAPAGVPRIAVTFALDQDGLLNVTAVEESSGQSCQIHITNEQGVGRLTPEEIHSMVAAADQAVAGDHRKRLAGRARQRCLALCEQIREAVRHLGSYISEQDQLRVLRDLDYTDSWLEAHPDSTAALFMREHRALERKVDSVLRKAYQAFIDAGNAAPPPCTGMAATAIKAEQEQSALGIQPPAK